MHPQQCATPICNVGQGRTGWPSRPGAEVGTTYYATAPIQAGQYYAGSWERIHPVSRLRIYMPGRREWVAPCSLPLGLRGASAPGSSRIMRHGHRGG